MTDLEFLGWGHEASDHSLLVLLCELQISLKQQENEESDWYMFTHYGSWMLQQHPGGMSTRLASAPPGELHA